MEQVRNAINKGLPAEYQDRALEAGKDTKIQEATPSA
jgi:hypothetical protein